MKNYLLGGLLITAVMAHAQAPIAFTIKGQVGKANAPAKVYLEHDGIMDSSAVRNGQFELKGTTDTPKVATLLLFRSGKKSDSDYLKAENSKDHVRLFLEKGPIILMGADSLETATITGSKLTTEYQKLQASLQPIDQKYHNLNKNVWQSATAEERKSPEIKNKFVALRTARTDETNQLLTAYIKANPSSFVSLDALTQVAGPAPKYAEVAPLYQTLTPAIQSSPDGKKFGEKLAAIKAISIGATAPNFSQKTPDGKEVSLADYRGKYVLVDFWASWCGPCRAENPNVIKVYNEYKSKNFDILGVSLDGEKARDKWVKAIEDDRVLWTQVSDLKGLDNAAARLYYIEAIPQNFLVDPSGKIVAHNLHGDELRTTLAQFIK
ncbi:TlpA disulfide reductase family protein [Hymenobacter crusticola]|uniref:Thioredoxin domain-containing protein n=1 Tax=Hymenobacter crusticola TaxID=1770526 RepID=A0A243W9J6_9BACT|nr:TlpA disulfide reductase family protein [Hymenobacter crusticola]OUJ71974.1 hypothetical protein BXP70_20395 [Hymenobacter crusticola]